MAYTHIAYFYDELMKDAPYDQWLNFTENIFQKYDLNVQTIADLGCGTGEVTIALAKQGYDLYGIDYSTAMLTCADQKAQSAQVNVQWLRQDLRQLSGLNNIDVMISYCDVINYITDQVDLQTVFNNVYNSLAHNGLFIFDVHAYKYMNEQLIGHTFADVTDDFSYIWHCLAGEHSGEAFHELTGFAKVSTNTYERINEVHHQRTFPIDVYKQLLSTANFSTIDIFNDFSIKQSSEDNQAMRIFFVAKK